MVRVGFVHYNTPSEIDRLVEALREIGAKTMPGGARHGG
jgi:selenocysteine lyase/cysteine desulfurase